MDYKLIAEKRGKILVEVINNKFIQMVADNKEIEVIGLSGLIKRNLIVTGWCTEADFNGWDDLIIGDNE